MPKITFMGAGSTVFARAVIGDSMLSPSLWDSHIALYDIDGARLKESKRMLDTLNKNINKKRARITGHLGVENRRAALKGADYVINAIQVGGYEPATVIDFDIPKKYGLRQTIGDTLGIGGIFRGLRTIPVVLDFARDMAKVCPDAWLLNYVNPMAMVTGAVQRYTDIKTVGLCHSYQVCAPGLLWQLDMSDKIPTVQTKIAGINHMAWLLEITEKGNDLYPEIRKRAAKKNREARKEGAEKHGDMVRFELMRHFGYYMTESSEHNAEYSPYWIKSQYPELVDAFNVPLDEYPRRCVAQIAHWKKQSRELVGNAGLTHKRTREYASYIMEAVETNKPYRIGGNIINTGFIPNLPPNACVEIPCMVDRNGVRGTYVGPLPEQLAALNRTNINVQLMTIEADATRRKDAIYQAAMLDPHTAAELPLDQIRRLCNDLIKAHGDMLPKYR
ncbi:MAG: alpha-glucosidase/alpha-galactosidase [Desulfobacterales bacterium]